MRQGVVPTKIFYMKIYHTKVSLLEIFQIYGITHAHTHIHDVYACTHTVYRPCAQQIKYYKINWHTKINTVQQKVFAGQKFHRTKLPLRYRKFPAHKSRGEKGENLQLYSITIQKCCALFRIIFLHMVHWGFGKYSVHIHVYLTKIIVHVSLHTKVSYD